MSQVTGLSFDYVPPGTNLNGITFGNPSPDIILRPQGSVLGASTNTVATNKTPVKSSVPAQQPTPTQVPQASGPSQSDITNEINSVYDASNSYLNQAESNLRSDLPTVLDEAQKQYELAIQGLSQGKDTTMGTIAEQGVQANQRKEDALSAARRLYNELRMGYQQRFGGSTSAGQAASELSSVEQQRQMGATTRGYSDTIRQLETQKVDVQKNYDLGVAQLAQQKQESINQINRDFQQKLLSISQNRSQLESQKAQARLQALQELRNQVFAINQQTLQFQQTLQAQKSAADLELETYSKKLGISSSGARSATSNYMGATTTNPTSGLTIDSYGSAMPGGTSAYTGSISKTVKGYDANGQPIYG